MSENPYRLRFNAPPTGIAARAPGMVLRTGLGGMGVGTMWSPEHEGDPDWVGAPPESPGFCPEHGTPLTLSQLRAE